MIKVHVTLEVGPNSKNDPLAIFKKTILRDTFPLEREFINHPTSPNSIISLGSVIDSESSEGKVRVWRVTFSNGLEALAKILKDDGWMRDEISE